MTIFSLIAKQSKLAMSLFLFILLMHTRSAYCFPWGGVFKEQGRYSRKQNKEINGVGEIVKTVEGEPRGMSSDNSLVNGVVPEKPLPEERSMPLGSTVSERRSRTKSNPNYGGSNSFMSPERGLSNSQGTPSMTETQIADGGYTERSQGREDISRQVVVNRMDEIHNSSHPLITREIKDIRKQIGPEIAPNNEQYEKRNNHEENEQLAEGHHSYFSTGALRSSLAQGIEETIEGLTRVYHSLHLFEGTTEHTIPASNESRPVSAEEHEQITNQAVHNSDVSDQEIDGKNSSHMAAADKANGDESVDTEPEQRSGKTGLFLLGIVSFLGGIGLMTLGYNRNRESNVQTPLYPPRGPSFV